MGAILKIFPRIPAREDYSPNYRLVGGYDLTAMIRGWFWIYGEIHLSAE